VRAFYRDARAVQAKLQNDSDRWPDVDRPNVDSQTSTD
jgi:hypothetical protein